MSSLTVPWATPSYSSGGIGLRTFRKSRTTPSRSSRQDASSRWTRVCLMALGPPCRPLPNPRTR